MEVTVALNCGRCGKKEVRELQLEEAQEMLTQNETRAEMLADLDTELNVVLKVDHPEIIIAHRVDDRYEIKTLDSLCHTPDAKRNKGCKTRVDALIGDIFMTNEAPPRKKKPVPVESDVTEE